jgi:hypothetical protein
MAAFVFNGGVVCNGVCVVGDDFIEERFMEELLAENVPLSITCCT